MGYKDPEKKRQYQKQWVAKRRKEWFDANGPCVKCGSSEQLELDHVDPSKKVDHVIWSWSASRQNEELIKCQVLCHNCHAEKTREQVVQKEHGVTMYRNGCRCSECKKSQRERACLYR